MDVEEYFMAQNAQLAGRVELLETKNKALKKEIEFLKQQIEHLQKCLDLEISAEA